MVWGQEYQDLEPRLLSMTNGNSDRQIERIATKDGPLLGVCFYRWAKVSCKGTYYGDAIDVVE